MKYSIAFLSVRSVLCINILGGVESQLETF